MGEQPMTDPDTTDPTKPTPLSAEQKQALVVQRKADAKAATQDYHAEEQALRDKTAKLRAERLEREKKAEPSSPKPRAVASSTSRS